MSGVTKRRASYASSTRYPALSGGLGMLSQYLYTPSAWSLLQGPPEHPEVLRRVEVELVEPDPSRPFAGLGTAVPSGCPAGRERRRCASSPPYERAPTANMWIWPRFSGRSSCISPGRRRRSSGTGAC